MIEITPTTSRKLLTSRIQPAEAVSYAKKVTKRRWTLKLLRNAIDGEVYQEIGGFRTVSNGPDDEPIQEFIDRYGVVYANSSKDIVLGFLMPEDKDVLKQRHAH